MSLDTSPLLYHPQRAHDGMWDPGPHPCPTPLQRWQVENAGVRDCRGPRLWVDWRRVGAAGLQSLSPIGFPWLLSSLRGQVSGPSSPLPEICCQCPFPALCVSDPRPAPPPAQLCCLVLGSWCVVAKLGRKRGRGHLCAGVHLATHACPRSMCLVQLTCSGTGDPSPPQKGLGECSSNSQKAAQDRAQSSCHL